MHYYVFKLFINLVKGIFGICKFIFYLIFMLLKFIQIVA